MGAVDLFRRKDRRDRSWNFFGLVLAPLTLSSHLAPLELLLNGRSPRQISIKDDRPLGEIPGGGVLFLLVPARLTVSPGHTLPYPERSTGYFVPKFFSGIQQTCRNRGGYENPRLIRFRNNSLFPRA